MCEYCDEEKLEYIKPIRRVDGIDLCVDESTLNLTLEYMLFGSGEDIEIEYCIRYCPMCGRDLRGDAEC